MYTGAEITAGGPIPVTYEQMMAFYVWATGRYASHAAYKADIRNQAINNYIRTHIFTQDMKTLWNLFSEPRNPAFADPLHFKRLLTYRDRLAKKITYMKTKLGKYAFTEETRVTRARLTQQRYESERQHYLRNTYFMLLTTCKFTLQTLTREEVNKEMVDDCAICMTKHVIRESCTTPCGHHFGTACLDKWKHSTCPLCRSIYSEVTQYVEE